jgi:hypothetical protein
LFLVKNESFLVKNRVFMVKNGLEIVIAALETFMRGSGMNVFVLETFVCVLETNVFAPETVVATTGRLWLKAGGDSLGSAQGGTVMKPSETGRRLPRTTTHGSRTARRCAKRSRAWAAASPLTGQGVALL